MREPRGLREDLPKVSSKFEPLHNDTDHRARPAARQSRRLGLGGALRAARAPAWLGAWTSGAIWPMLLLGPSWPGNSHRPRGHPGGERPSLTRNSISWRRATRQKTRSLPA
jgi:hypothetical protein